jgi:hypothetical protein
MESNALDEIVQEDITLYVIEPVITINWLNDDRSLPGYELVGFYDHICKSSFRQRPIQELKEVVKRCLAEGYLPNIEPYKFRGDFHELSLSIKSIKGVKPSDIVTKFGYQYYGDTEIGDAFGHKDESIILYEVIYRHSSDVRHEFWPDIYRLEPYDDFRRMFDSERDLGLKVFLEPTIDLPVYRIQSPQRLSPNQIKSSWIRQGSVLQADIDTDDNGNQSYKGRRIV